MCDFQSVTWECRGDGYLWDADHDGYDPEDVSEPCPKCNTKVFLLERKECAETTSSGSNMFSEYTGESLWLRAVQYAETHNATATAAALAEIRLVETLRPAKNKAGYEVVTYVYDGQNHLSKVELPALADLNVALAANSVWKNFTARAAADTQFIFETRLAPGVWPFPTPRKAVGLTIGYRPSPTGSIQITFRYSKEEEDEANEGLHDLLMQSSHLMTWLGDEFSQFDALRASARPLDDAFVVTYDDGRDTVEVTCTSNFNMG